MQCQGSQFASLLAHHIGLGHVVQLKTVGDRTVVKISFVDIEIERSAREMWDALSAASFEITAAIDASPIGENDADD